MNEIPGRIDSDLVAGVMAAPASRKITVDNQRFEDTIAPDGTIVNPYRDAAVKQAFLEGRVPEVSEGSILIGQRASVSTIQEKESSYGLSFGSGAKYDYPWMFYRALDWPNGNFSVSTAASWLQESDPEVDFDTIVRNLRNQLRAFAKAGLLIRRKRNEYALTEAGRAVAQRVKQAVEAMEAPRSLASGPDDITVLYYEETAGRMPGRRVPRALGSDGSDTSAGDVGSDILRNYEDARWGNED